MYEDPAITQLSTAVCAARPWIVSSSSVSVARLTDRSTAKSHMQVRPKRQTEPSICNGHIYGVPVVALQHLPH